METLTGQTTTRKMGLFHNRVSMTVTLSIKMLKRKHSLFALFLNCALGAVLLSGCVAQSEKTKELQASVAWTLGKDALPTDAKVLGGTKDGGVYFLSEKDVFFVSAQGEVKTSSLPRDVAPGEQHVVSQDGALFLPAFDDNGEKTFIYTVYEGGKPREFSTPDSISPLVTDEQGNAYFLSEKGVLYKLSRNAEVVFSKQLCKEGYVGDPYRGDKPVLYGKGTLYAGCEGLHKLNSEGNVLWSVTSDATTPLLSEDGKSVYTWGYNSVFAFSLDGKLLWSFEGPLPEYESIWYAPVIIGNAVYALVRFESDPYLLYALDVLKRKAWSPIGEKKADGSFSYIKLQKIHRVNDRLAAGCMYNGEILGFSGKGTVLWKKKYTEVEYADARCDVSNGQIYTYEDKISVLDEKGTLLWEYPAALEYKYDADNKRWLNKKQMREHHFDSEGRLVLYEASVVEGSEEEKDGEVYVDDARALVVLSREGKELLRYPLALEPKGTEFAPPFFLRDNAVIVNEGDKTIKVIYE